ncbi:MAG TPA: transcription termination/antitermination protein NusG [Candidatus Ozemobacteraceae bacterium]|mgnify:FL=1|nr:transcription termination/antitermination protein NusG [Candidatus Ozemobacteraceae bacterium]
MIDILKGKWYVIHTQSGAEDKVRQNLEHRISLLGKGNCIFRVVVPKESTERVQDGERVTQSRKIYPGYVLVQMDLDDDTWTVVKNTPGVTGFVGLGEKPTPLHEKEVQNVLRTAGLIDSQRSQAMTPIGFSEGQTVKIIDGPFTDFIGVIKEINVEKRKAKVLVFIFGRDTAIEVDLIQLEEA